MAKTELQKLFFSFWFRRENERKILFYREKISNKNRHKIYCFPHKIRTIFSNFFSVGSFVSNLLMQWWELEWRLGLFHFRDLGYNRIKVNEILVGFRRKKNGVTIFVEFPTTDCFLSFLGVYGDNWAFYFITFLTQTFIKISINPKKSQKKIDTKKLVPKHPAPPTKKKKKIVLSTKCSGKA